VALFVGAALLLFLCNKPALKGSENAGVRTLSSSTIKKAKLTTERQDALVGHAWHVQLLWPV
jgi:hypothetical protein